MCFDVFLIKCLMVLMSLECYCVVMCLTSFGMCVDDISCLLLLCCCSMILFLFLFSICFDGSIGFGARGLRTPCRQRVGPWHLSLFVLTIWFCLQTDPPPDGAQVISIISMRLIVIDSVAPVRRGGRFSEKAKMRNKTHATDSCLGRRLLFACIEAPWSKLVGGGRSWACKSGMLRSYS